MGSTKATTAGQWLRKHRLAALVAVVLITGIVVLWCAQPRKLLDIGVPVCVVQEWRSDHLYPSLDHYYWLSNNQMLVRADDERAGVTRYYRWSSGTVSPAPVKVSRILAQPSTMFIGVSPDGRWRAWRENRNIRRRSGIHLAAANADFLVVSALDGSHELAWEIKTDETTTQISWMPDSQKLCCLQGGAIPSADLFFLPGAKQKRITLPESARGKISSRSLIVGFTPVGRAVVALDFMFQSQKASGSFALNGGVINQPKMQFMELGLEKDVAPPHLFSLAAPPGADAGYALLSPQGDRLLWATASEYKPPLETWLHRFIPAVHAEAKVLESGWISNLDGTDMRQIGIFEVKPEKTSQNGEGPWIIDPQWAPDGRKASFLYKNTIYVVRLE